MFPAFRRLHVREKGARRHWTHYKQKQINSNLANNTKVMLTKIVPCVNYLKAENTLKASAVFVKGIAPEFSFNT
jgi:hypothetical protein